MAEIDLIKISELPATSTIGDADELAVVQGGATKKVPYSVLKTGAEVTPDTTLSEAGVPADAAAVGAALSLKANQAAVTQALAAKADKTEVTDISGDIAELASVVETKADQTALNQKADKTTTDALRQDLTTLNGIVNQKADKTELNTQIGNVTAELATKANTADVNNLLAAKANVASPVFTGRPQAPTAAKGTATLQLATTAFVQNAIDDKQDTLTFDAAPTQGSTNPVTSGGVYTAVEDAKDEAETAIGEVREESEEATAEAREIALKAFATPTASGQLVTLTDGADGIPAKKLTLNLSPHQSGSGDPSPENVRPISWYESVKVTRAGKNLLNIPDKVETVNGVTATIKNGVVTLSGTPTARAVIYLVRGVAVPSGAYILSGPTANLPPSCFLNFSSGNGISVSLSQARREIGVTLPDASTGESNAYVRLDIASGASVDGFVFKPMIREASFIADSFEPYQGEDYTVAIPTEAGTVYGGTLTVNDDGSGTLTVDMAITTISALTWFYDTAYLRFASTSIANVVKRPVNNDDNTRMVCSMYRSGSISTDSGNRIAIAASGNLFIYEDAYTDVTEFVNARGAAQIVYPIAEPTTYTLTASQVTTLLGNNTLWMDADGTIDLQYRADTQKYIDSRIALLNANLAFIEDGMTASRAYSVGQYVLISGQLYKVTSAIASGATFTVGTNVVATTVGNELTAFN